MLHRAVLSAVLLLTVFTGGAQAQNKTSAWLLANFEARSHTSPSVTMVYRLYKPVGYNPSQKYPIVVALHGGGERGSDNSNQLTREELAQPWVRDSVQAKHPHFVMIPQAPSNLAWSPSNTWDGNRNNANLGIVQILDSLKREFSLDTTRFYVAGLSMGGFGSFELMKWNPTMFAAAVPTAGGGDTAAAVIQTYTRTPMWAFHSLSDPTVSAQRGSRTIVTKMEGALGKPILRFTSDPNQQNPVAFDSVRGVVSVDSLRKAVYVDSVHFLYSEVRNAPGTGNPLHQAGWWEAWRHPMLTDWVFSKRKVGGVTAIAAASPGRGDRRVPANVKMVFRDGRTLLERTVGGRTTWYTLDGQRLPSASTSTPAAAGTTAAH